MLDHHIRQATFPDAMRRHLRFQVADAFSRIATVGHDQRHGALVHPAAQPQLQRRNDDAFLVQLRAQRRRPGRHAADIGVMRSAGHKIAQFATGEDRRNHRDIGQMRPAVIRIVEHDHIAGVKILKLVDRRRH